MPADPSPLWLKYLPSAWRKRLAAKPGLHAAIGNSGWLLLDRMVRIVLGLVIGIWMARALGPIQFGQFNYALAYVALFSSIATLGLDGIVVRNLVLDPDSRETILGTAFVLKAAGAAVAIVLGVTSIPLVAPHEPQIQALVAIIALGLLFQACDAIDFWFQSQTSSKYTVVARMPSLAIFFCARVLLILSGASLAAFAWAQTLELAVGALGLVVVYQRLDHSVMKWRPVFDHAVRLLRESWPLVLAGLSVMLYMKIDIVMLGKMSGARETGLYSAATRLSEGFYFIPMIITSSLAPLLLQARAAGPAQYRQRMLKLYVLMTRLGVAVALPLAVAAPFLIRTLFGDDYMESVAIFRIHIWATIAVFLGVASSQYLTNEGQQKMSLYRTLLGLLSNVLLNLLLIPAYGGLGAAVATLISYFVATFSIFLARSGAEQGKLMLRAMNPKLVVGFRRS
ncbi:MAG: flippase [Burkholderiales bacterium]